MTILPYEPECAYNCIMPLLYYTMLELLEVPQLMDTCVRNELYDEALSLLGFSSTLERRHLLNNDTIMNQDHNTIGMFN